MREDITNELINEDKDLDIDKEFDKGLDDSNGELTEQQTNLLKSLVDFDNRIKNVVSSWLGLIWDAEAEKLVKNPHADEIMNHKGVNFFVDLFRTYLDKTNTMASISKKAYTDMMSDVIDITWMNLANRKEEFGIKSMGDMLKIGTQVEHTVSLMLRSLAAGGYRSVLKENYGFSESDNTTSGKEGSVPKTIRKIFGPKEDF